MALRHSYVYHVLRFLRNGQARTAQDLFRLLAVERENMRFKEGKRLVVPETIEKLEEVLAGLEEIGVVPVDTDNDVSPHDDPPLSDFHGASGRGAGGGGLGGPIGPDAGDGDGGAGLSELLGHAVLFCLSDDAQEALLDATFNAGSSEEGVHG